jgi:hypothetical protein
VNSSARVRRTNIMTTPQDSPKRRKQKARRTKQLAEWREKKVTGSKGGVRGGGKTSKAKKTAAATKKDAKK